MRASRLLVQEGTDSVVDDLTVARHPAQNHRGGVVELGQLGKEPLHRSEVARYANVERPPAGVEGNGELSTGRCEHVETVPAGDHQFPVGPPAQPPLSRVGGLHQDGERRCGVSPLSVREPVQVHRGGFEGDREAGVEEVHGDQRGQVAGALVGDDGVDDRILGGGFVQVEGDVDLLGVDQRGYGPCNPLGEGAVLEAGVGAIEVAGLDTGEGLAGARQLNRPVVFLNAIEDGL